MKLLYNFCSRERPAKLIAAIENIIAMARHDNFVILVTMDIDDKSCANVDFSKKLLSYDKVMPVYGFSKNKIDAVNRDIFMVEEWQILLNHSDDMKFIKEGFDLDVIKEFENFSGLLHFPDQKAKERLCTYAIMSRDYYEQDGWVYHPGFMSVYADNFQHSLAQKRNAYKFVNKDILRHEHPMWGFGEFDDLLKRTEEPTNYEKDRITFERLKIEYGL